MDLKALEQIAIEDKYSKKELNKLLYKDLTSSPAVLNIYDEMTSIIRSHAAKRHTFWDTKQERYRLLIEYNDLRDVVTYILVALLRTEGKIQEIHSTVNYIGTRLSGYKDIIDAVRTASELLAITMPLNTHRLIEPKQAPTGVLSVQSAYVISQHTKELIADHMYLPPMITQPNEILTNACSGYLNPEFESVILKHYNHHNKPLNLNPINIANSIEWELDEEILAFEEKSKKKLDTVQKLNNFILMKNASRKVYNMLLKAGNCFFLSWRFGKRGRMYSQGYHVNLQSTDYKKAILSLYNKEVIKME